MSNAILIPLDILAVPLSLPEEVSNGKGATREGQRMTIPGTSKTLTSEGFDSVWRSLSDREMFVAEKRFIQERPLRHCADELGVSESIRKLIWS